MYTGVTTTLCDYWSMTSEGTLVGFTDSPPRMGCTTVILVVLRLSKAPDTRKSNSMLLTLVSSGLLEFFASIAISLNKTFKCSSLNKSLLVLSCNHLRFMDGDAICTA